MLEIYDCTIRETAQSYGTSLSKEHSLELVKILDDFGVAYIELGWPMVSDKVKDLFAPALKEVKNSKIVAFGSTSKEKEVEKDPNLNSIIKTGVRYACIFGKSHPVHVDKGLGITLEENLSKIEKSVSHLISNGLEVFYDAEHYFDGYKMNREYALSTIEKALEAGAKRVVLCDTNGGMMPSDVKRIVKETRRNLEKRIHGLDARKRLGIHLHDDCGVSVASALEVVEEIKQVQGTITGLGERVGNMNLSTFLANYVDKMKKDTRVDLRKLTQLSRKAFRLSGVSAPHNSPYVGDVAFAHKAGVHASGQRKGAAYNHTDPERFGNSSRTILSSSGGKSAVKSVAEEIGYNIKTEKEDLDHKVKKMYEELEELEQRGYDVGTIPAEQYLLMDKHFGEHQKLFDIRSWRSGTEYDEEGKSMGSFEAKVKIGEEEYTDSLKIMGGQVDAGFNMIKSILKKRYPYADNVHLLDFRVNVADDREEKSTVRTEVLFKNNEAYTTVGVGSDMVIAAMEAIDKGFRYHLLRNQDKRRK